MFGDNTPASLILKTVLLHQSINMNFWPPAAPISNEEVRAYVDRELAPLLLVMNLSDNDGWNLFYADAREKARLDTVQVFEEIEKLILQGA
jgi:hypothetical protein